MLFDVQVTTAGSATVVTVIGDVDLASLPRLAAALDDYSTGDRVLDLRSVDWFDPICFGVLLTADLRARRQGGSLVVKAAGAVAALLEETRLDSVLEIEG